MRTIRGLFLGLGQSVCIQTLCCCVISALAALPAAADAVRSQTIDLKTGWNAVYLEVDPAQGEPSLLFEGTPVDQVASFTTPLSGAQFVENPSAGLDGAYGWAVWYAPERGDSILTSLYTLNGDQPYLIHARTNASLTITGTVPTVPKKWNPNAYNFVGFTVQNPGAPSFEQFFSASPAHNHNKIYRLLNGTWRQVLDPGNVQMRSGEAFWIYCEGHSSYTGPLDVSVPSVLGLLLDAVSSSEIIFRNRTDHPVAFWVDHQPDQNTPIPLQTIIRAVDTDQKGLRDLTVDFGPGPWNQAMPTLEAGGAVRLPIRVQTQIAPPGTSHSLLRVRSDMGTEIYIPVTAYMDDLN